MQVDQMKETEENTDVRIIQTEDGKVPFLKDIWSFFGKKGVKTRFFSVNSDASYRVDIEICESLGCPIQILTENPELEKKWETIRTTIKNRKLSDEDKDKEWLQGTEKKWILPKNLVVKTTQFTWDTLKNEIASLPENRCDILKIEGSYDCEHMMLYSLFTSGYRPGILLIRYTEDPDANVPSMMTAGQLHMAGYKLIEVTEKWFLYIYTDVCLYESVSMRNKKVQNPIATYLGELFAESYKAKGQGQGQGQPQKVVANEEEKKVTE